MNIPQHTIQFNPEFHRYEVYSSRSVIRNYSKQPVFVSASYVECHSYIESVEGVLCDI